MSRTARTRVAHGDAVARYELAEDDLMKRKPRNAQTDRLTNGRLFFLGYCTLGVRARAPAAVRDV